MTIPEMIKAVNATIARCDAPEKETYEALLSEADGWQMRVDELEEAEEKTKKIDDD